MKHKDIYLMLTKELHRAHHDTEIEPRKRAGLLRSSSLPYCPLKEFFEKIADPEEYQVLDIGNRNTFAIGTVVHTILQNTYPRKFKKINIFGYWKPDPLLTPNCIGSTLEKQKCPYYKVERRKRKYQGRKTKDVLVPTTSGKKGCKVCGGYPAYEELDFTNKWTSHIDGIFKEKKSNRCFIVDYKTTSKFKVDKYRTDREGLPHKNNVYQICSYMVTAKEFLQEHGLELLDEAYLIYVDKMNDKNHCVIPVSMDLKDLEKKLKKVSWGYHLVSRSLKGKKGMGMNLESAELVMKQKLCDNKEYYDEFVGKTYNKEGKMVDCPLADICFKSDEKILKRIKKQLKEHPQEPEKKND